MNAKHLLLLVAIATTLLSSCISYKQSVMFNVDTYPLSEAESVALDNYKLEPFDQFKLEVYTHNGERIIDPNFELVPRDITNVTNLKPDPAYSLLPDGYVRLPLVGRQYLQGLTLNEAEQLLQKSFNDFYKDCYVLMTYQNKRVVVLGGVEKKSQVVKLDNEGMTVLEVLALAGGLPRDSKAQNIRLIRGDLAKPQVYVLDLSTIQGLTLAQTKILPGDILYIEPVIRPIPEAVRDYIPLLTAATSILTLLVVIQNL